MDLSILILHQADSSAVNEIYSILTYLINLIITLAHLPLFKLLLSLLYFLKVQPSLLEYITTNLTYPLLPLLH